MVPSRSYIGQEVAKPRGGGGDGRDGGVARGGLRGGGWDGRLRKPPFEGAWGRKAHFIAATGRPVPLAKAL